MDVYGHHGWRMLSVCTGRLDDAVQMDINQTTGHPSPADEDTKDPNNMLIVQMAISFIASPKVYHNLKYTHISIRNK